MGLPGLSGRAGQVVCAGSGVRRDGANPGGFGSGRVWPPWLTEGRVFG